MAAQPEQKLPLDNIAGLDKVTTREFIKLAMTDDYREGVAKFIKQRRISMGLNLWEVAIKSGISSNT